MVALGYLMIQLAVFKVKRINDSGRVANPGTISTLKDDMKAEDGSVSICQYDLAKLQESKFQYVMTAAISSLPRRTANRAASLTRLPGRHRPYRVCRGR